MIEEMIGKQVVVDLRSTFVCLGTLEKVDEIHLSLRDADMHDLRDTSTSRENYIVASRHTGIKRNRKRILIVRTEIVGISLLEDVVEE